jgi:hypothetical protein
MTEKAQYLEAVSRAIARFEEARQALDDAVRAALDHGASWADIGGLLGVSRQAAFQRFGPKQASPDRDESAER